MRVRIDFRAGAAPQSAQLPFLLACGQLNPLVSSMNWSAQSIGVVRSLGTSVRPQGRPLKSCTRPVIWHGPGDLKTARETPLALLFLPGPLGLPSGSA